MKIRCIDNALDVLPLTINKIYEVLGERKNTFTISDDKNIRAYYLKERFEIIEEDNMKQLTFKKVIRDIKGKEKWENKYFIISKEEDDRVKIECKIGKELGCSAIYIGENDLFTLKQQPVTFEEALNSDKECRVEHKYISKEHALEFDTFGNLMYYLSDHFRTEELKEILKDGKWYLKN